MKKQIMALILLLGVLVIPPVPAAVNLTEIDTIPVRNYTMYIALTPDGSKLYVVGATALSVIDTLTKQVVVTIPLETGKPMKMAIAPDGKYAYLAVSNASGSTASGGSNRVDVIDISTNTIVATIPIHSISDYGPTGIVVTPDGSEVYVTVRGAYKVDVISTATHTVTDSILLEPETVPVGIAITPDGSRAYVVNRENSTVSVIDTTTKTVKVVIPVSNGPSVSRASVAITPDGNYAYVTFAGDGTIAVIDTDPMSSTFNKQVGSISTTSTDFTEITINSKGDMAFVTGSTSNDMLVIDTDPNSPSFHTQTGTVKIGDFPFGVVSQHSPGIVEAYVSNASDRTISIIGYQETCQLYAVHDEGRNDSQLIMISETFEVKALGALKPDYDLEALDIHPQTGEVYVASGRDTDKPGYLYKVNKLNGGLTDIGSTGFAEIDGLSFALDGTLWGWAQDVGLLTIDTDTGDANVVVKYAGEIEDLTWNIAGTILYGVENLRNNPDTGVKLLAYTPSTGIVETKCEALTRSLEIEAIDTLPDDSLIFGFHGKTTLSLGAIDITTCQIIAEKEIPTGYNDIEGIAYPSCYN